MALLSFLTTAIASLVGAIVLKIFRSVHGAWVYWISGLTITGMLLVVQQSPLAAVVVSTWLCVGIYHEFEIRGRATFWIAGLSTSLATAAMILLPIVFGWATGRDFISEFQGLIQQNLQELQKARVLNPEALNVSAVFAILPGILWALQILNLAFSIIFATRLGQVMGFKINKASHALRLYEFRVPEVLIWVFLLCAALVLLKNQPLLKNVGINGLIVFATAYFFHGLAIAEVGFVLFRWGFFLRLAFYLLLVGQLPFVLSGLGVVDYWLNFRERFKVWANKSKNRPNNKPNNQGRTGANK